MTRLAALILFLAFGFSSYAKSINMHYSGGDSKFNKLEIKITPNLQALRFTSWAGKRFSMDCSIKGDHLWSCRSTCSTGSLELKFNSATGFKSFVIEKVDIVPRQCDGTASPTDRPVKFDEPLTFTMRTRKGSKKAKPKK